MERLIEQFAERHPYLGLKKEGPTWKNNRFFIEETYSATVEKTLITVGEHDFKWQPIMIMPNSVGYAVAEQCLLHVLNG